MSAYSSLPRRRRKFVDAYLRLGVGRDAYLAVYGQVKQPDACASRLLADAAVAAAVAEREKRAMENAGITRTRAWMEVRRVAFFDHRKLVDENGDPRQLHELDEDTAAAIAGIDIEELFAGRGEDRVQIGVLKKYRAWNKNEALKMILQAYGALLDRHELSGPNGGPIPIDPAGELSDLDRARRIAFLLARGLSAAASAPNPGNPAGGSPPAQSNQQEIQS